jgi:hypothetical protein
MNKKVEKQIPVTTFNWGPCLIKLNIEEEYRKLFLEESKNNTEDYRNKLAGIIDHETGYNAKSKEKLLPILSMYLGVYDQMFEKFTQKPYEKRPEYVMSALWINHQKSGEYNPPHDHDGKLSFVIYLQIPDELKKENQAYEGKSCGPGGIQFVYGDGPRECVSIQTFFPEEGEMFIFPAWLKHWVAPFKSDCTRISVSGNFHDSAPLNNIVEFAPKHLREKKK